MIFLIILDFRMKMNGIQLHQQIKDIDHTINISFCNSFGYIRGIIKYSFWHIKRTNY